MLALCIGVNGTQNEVIHPKSCTEELAESAFEQQFWLKRTDPFFPLPLVHMVTELHFCIGR